MKLLYWGNPIIYYIYPLWQLNLSSLTATQINVVGQRNLRVTKPVCHWNWKSDLEGCRMCRALFLRKPAHDAREAACTKWGFPKAGSCLPSEQMHDCTRYIALKYLAD